MSECDMCVTLGVRVCVCECVVCEYVLCGCQCVNMGVQCV